MWAYSNRRMFLQSWWKFCTGRGGGGETVSDKLSVCSNTWATNSIKLNITCKVTSWLSLLLTPSRKGCAYTTKIFRIISFVLLIAVTQVPVGSRRGLGVGAHYWLLCPYVSGFYLKTVNVGTVKYEHVYLNERKVDT